MKYAIYSSTGDRPVIRDWFDSEAEAQAALPRFQQLDHDANGRAEERYTVVELADVEESFYAEAGF